VSVSGDMVKRAWEEVKHPQQWVQLPHMRAWENRDGRRVTDLSLMQQMKQQGLLTTREVSERMPPV